MFRSRAERESFVLESGSGLPAHTVLMKTEIICEACDWLRRALRLQATAERML